MAYKDWTVRPTLFEGAFIKSREPSIVVFYGGIKMKVKNSIIVACFALSAAVAGAVDWNNPQLVAADMDVIKVSAPKPVVVAPKVGVSLKVSLHVLTLRAKFFLGKSVTTEAVLENRCGAAKPCFTLQVGNGSREDGLPVVAFLPLRTSPPTKIGKSLPVMSDLVGKRLELTGAIEEHATLVNNKPVFTFKFKVGKYKIIIKK